MASLAFVNGLPGYLAQGPYCSLPVRPFWFRLGLSWIPRYCIMLTILGLYIAIYVHVALQFRTVGWLRKLQANPNHTGGLSDPADTRLDGIDEKERHPSHTLGIFTKWHPKRSSTPSSSIHFDKRQSKDSFHGSTLLENGLRFEGAADHKLSGATVAGSSGSISEKVTTGETWADGPSDFITNALSPNDNSGISRQEPGSPKSKTFNDPAEDKIALARMESDKEMRKRHAAIQRQVRTLFIYPIVYFVMWLIPFVNHAMNYSNYRAQHPIFGLVLANFMCISTIGSVDCLVFSLREKPWRQIPSSDGTFWGSFKWWKQYNERRSSTTSAHSEFSGTRVGSGSMTPHPRLGSIAENAEYPDRAENASSDPTVVPTRQLDRIQELNSWDFARDGGGSIQSAASERHWFDRRLSVAVGRSVQPNVFGERSR